MKTLPHRLSVWLLALALPIPQATFAAAEPDAGCKGTSPAELRTCATLEFRTEDKILNDTYRSRMRALPPAEKGVLRDKQRQWLSERDASCIRELELGDGYAWGDHDHLIFIGCQTDKTRLRTDALLKADDLKQAALNPSCQGSSATVDLNSCAGGFFEAADRELNSTYQAIMKSLSPDLRTYLRNDQRYWLERMNASCERQLAGVDHYECRQRATETRVETLRIWARRPGFEPVPAL